MTFAIEKALAASCFVAAVRSRDPGRFGQWQAQGLFESAAEAAALRQEILSAADRSADEAAVKRALREIRNRELARIAVREICGLAPLDETLAALSDLAESSCEAALRFAQKQLQARYGVPRDERGEAAQPVLLGLGKLGGRELNFSSDIDLIWAYTAPGATDGERAISNEEFFAKLALDAGRILSEKTEHGFVFRVDTLLRPFGSAGALAWHFEALENYYQEHGRDWERYALIKARPVAGDLDAGAQLLETLRPFVYRRYLDFNAIGGLRELKRLIAEEVSRKGLADNIKLGAGGIREIEFIVQAFQLVRGGQEPMLRGHRLRPVLRYLGEAGHLSTETAARLDECYVFLRRVENAIQIYEDQQTHTLPESEAARAALCLALDFRGWDRFRAELDVVRGLVQAEFERLFKGPQQRAPAPLERAIAAYWSGDEALGELAEALRKGFGDDAQRVAGTLEPLRESRMVRGLSESAQRRLCVLLALLLEECAAQARPELAARRVLEVVQAIAGRSTYLTLLRESATARQQLLRLCAASPWITQLLARSPVLLDQLLDPRTLYSPPQRAEMQAELAEVCDPIQPGDTESAMEALRRYRQEAMLRVAACDLAGQLPLRKVCDHLTWLAETILGQALRFAWDELRPRYGEPPEPAFAVAGYGKLGGIELGYGSDLDLVFLFDGAPEAETIGGERTISTGEFYGKLVQRIVHYLATRTHADRAYEVDLELRPSGRSGLLVTSLAGFRDYQLREAWTWEHQALCRARAVAGHEALRHSFEQTRIEVLAQRRDPQKLLRDVLEMRARMHRHLEKRAPGRYDLKQASGGMTDLEFITQYLVLRETCREPRLIEFSDNRRQLEALARAGVLEPAEEARMIEIYDAYRAWFHARDLQQADDLAEDAAFRSERSDIQALWQKYLRA